MMVRGSRKQVVERRRSWSRRRRLHLEQLENRLLLDAGLSKVFAPATIGPGSVSTIIFTLSNNNQSTITGLAFTDVLPTGPGPMTVAAPANASTTCDSGVVTAPDGSGTITFSGGLLGVGQSCTVTVDVTASTPGVHTNPSIVLNYNESEPSFSSPADLTVVTSRPGFSKSFSPSSVPMGDRSTLTFTIDNTANASGVSNLDFTDTLPAGMVIANPANASTTCNSGNPAFPTTLTAAAGANVITLDANGFVVLPSFDFPVVAAGSTCTVTVDVTATGVGKLDNVSGELLANSLSSGKASATLESTVTTIALDKDFVDDPVPPGGSVTVDFIVTNRDRSDSATGIAFTDDLAAGLAGLTFDSLLANDCGGTVTGVGTTDLGLTGGTLEAGASCTISASLSVPAAAEPGVYTNTTGAITATLGGSPVVGNVATDSLFVSAAPIFTKEFTDDPVGAGGTVNLRFTITNVDPNSDLNDIAFTDELTTFLPSPLSVTLPSGGFCGGSSTVSVVSTSFGQAISVSGASLAPGASCTFDVGVNIPVSFPGGAYINTTSELTATIDTCNEGCADPVTGAPATDTLTVAAAPTLSKEFTNDPVPAGGTANLQFTITHGNEETVGDAVAITFADDLNAALSRLVAIGLPLNDVCGTGSQISGTGLLTFSGGSLAAGESCTFSIAVEVPAGAAPGSHTNTTSNITAVVLGVSTEGASAADDLQVAGLAFTKSFLNDPVIAGDTVNLEFTITNATADLSASSISFTDNLGSKLTGLVATGLPQNDICGTGSSLTGTSVLSLAGGNLNEGESCTFSVTLQVPAGAASDTYLNTTSSLSGSFGEETILFSPASDTLTVNSTLLQLSKEFTDDPVAPGGTTTLVFTLTNLDATRPASGIDFSDDLDAALTGLVATGATSNTCGGAAVGMPSAFPTSFFDYVGGSLGAGASCTISLLVDVPAGAVANTYTNITSAVTGTIGGLAVTGEPAIDNLVVTGPIEFSKSFDGPTTATGTPVLTFTISNTGLDATTGLAFSDDLDAVISGLVATNLPLSDVCGTGSLLSGTSTLMLTGGELGPMSSCTFNIELLVPVTATAGTFPNTTSVLSQSGLTVADPATADLVIEPPPTFAKGFSPSTIQAGEVSTLTFTVDNSASGVAADGLSFIDNLPAGVVIADPTGAATTCTGGMGDATPGATSFSFAGGAVAAGASCTVQFNVTSATPGTYVNTTGDLTSTSGNSGTAADTLTVFAPPEFSKVFAPDTVAINAVSTLTFTIENTANVLPAASLDVTDNLPAGVVVATPANASTTCSGGTLTAASGSGSIAYSGGSLAAGGTCTIQVDVVSSTPGGYDNTSGDLTSSLGNSGTASDTLVVIAPPEFSKSFAPDIIAVNVASTLTFTIDNTANVLPASSLDFTDSLPSGVVVATPASTSNSCSGGTLTAASGSSSIAYSGGSVAAGTSCTIQVGVVSSTPGSYDNTSGDLTSSLGNSGTASDTLIVVAPPEFSKSFSPNTIGLNETSTLTFTIDNTANPLPATSIDFADTLPAGVVISAMPNASTDCTDGVLTAAAGTMLVSYSGGSLAAGGSCTVQVDVTGSGVGSHVNTTGALTSSLGNSGTAGHTLTVEALTFDKSFLPDVIGVGSTSTLTFEIVNLINSPVSGVAFTDNLPAGLTIAAPANASSTCGGTVDAPNGGSTIALSAGGVGPLGTCTVTVNVTSSIADTYSNVTSALQTSVGDIQAASADLFVVNYVPGFSKSFSPASISQGTRSTLTFTIDNSSNEGSSATELDFIDDLPAGIVIASPSNASTSCTGGVLTAVPGTSVISYTMGTVGALASCTVSVDVVGTAVGLLGNTSGELMSSVILGDETQTVSSGKASAMLEVVGDSISLIKSFTNDPVPPGGTVNLEFTITNFSRDESATNITFTDNLSATLSGLVAVGLPQSDVCGTGSTLSGTSLLTLSGASLGPGESCTFSTTLQVPAAAATGVYPNTTSSITGDVSGETITGAPGNDDLFVRTAPILTKSFTDDPIGGGGAVNLHFNIQNTNATFSAVNIGFTDNLDATLPGLTVAMLPAVGFCGTGSSLTSVLILGELTLVMTGGSLPASGSCGFDVTLLVPAAAPGGTYPNTTSEITALVNEVPLAGNPASDDLVVVAAPRLRKEFTNNPVLPGANANLEFTLTYDSESVAGDATSIHFTDNLNAALAGLSAVGLPLNDICGTGSQLSGTTNLSFTGGSLTPGSTCTFSVPVKVPLASLPGSFTNETSNVTATVDGVTAMSVPATDVLQVAGLAISKEFTNDPVPAGGTVTLQFTIDNVSQVSDATNITFTDNLNDTLTGLVATGTPLSNVCGTGSQLSGTNTLELTGGNLPAGQSCTFSITLQVPAAAASGQYVNTTSRLGALFDGTAVSLNPATDVLTVASDLLLLDKSFVEASAYPGDTVTLDFTITNLDASQSVTNITFTDDLNAALAGLVAVGLPASNVCGAGSQLTGTSLLTLSGATLGPGASCSFSATVQLPADIPFGSSVDNVTSQATGDLGGLQVTADPASDQLLIDFFRFSKSFSGLTSAGGTPTLSFTIENLGDTTASDLSFSDNLGAVIPGLTATGLPASGVCGAGSQLAGTSVLTFTGGSLGAGASCTFNATLQVPSNAMAGTYTNVTSDLLASGAFGSSPATDSLTVVPPPEFDKTFTPDGIAVTGVSTLSFSINNAASPLGATGLAFTDNLPAGVTVAVPPNASTTCTGGILTAAAGSSVITYSGGAVAGGASCSVQVDVTSALSGSHLNVSGDLTSSLGNSGPASATLISQIMLMGGPFTPGLNLLTISKGLSDAITILVKGTQPGSTQLTVQGVTFTTAFADPVVVAFAETVATDAPTFYLLVTEAQVGQTLQYQAVQILPVLDVSAVLSVDVVDAPLLAAGGQAILPQGESAGGTTLTPALLRSVAAQAIERWEGMGLTQAEIDRLHAIKIQISDLSPGLLGELVGDMISIDYSAADHGWFVDGTLGDSAEFGTTLSQTESGADAGGPADQRMDLFTAVLHEFGHVLKFEDASTNQLFRGVMTAELPTSVRRLPTRWQNPSYILDVNDDGSISPLDGLLIINEMNEPTFLGADGHLPSSVPEPALRRFLDTNGDGFVTAVDVLRIINHLNGFNALPEGEAPPHVVDLALLGLQFEQPSLTSAAPLRTAAVHNANRDTQSLVVQSVPCRAQDSDLQSAAADAQAADSDLALLEWLEQQSSDDTAGD